MATFDYEAKRSIKSGHTLGTAYTITIALQQLDDEQPDFVGSQHVAISGRVVTTLNRYDKYLQLTLDYIEADGSGTPDLEDLVEFFDSVIGGEQFTFNNGADQVAILSGKPTRIREGNKFKFSFRIRLL